VNPETKNTFIGIGSRNVLICVCDFVPRVVGRPSAFGGRAAVWACLSALLFSVPAFGQLQTQVLNQQLVQPTMQESAQRSGQQLAGTIGGAIVDRSGAAVSGAQIKLTRDDHSPSQDVLSGDDGQFSFAGVEPGPFHLTISSVGFATQTISGTLNSGESYVVPQIALVVATNVTEVKVVAPREEVAELEIKEQEKQRIFGVIPNFYISYVPNAVPLTSKQKFELAWKSSIDPVTFVIVGATAGIQQATNGLSGYGQGAEGYAKRYGAGYGDFLSSTFMGGAVFPSILKQDPRYFYKGTGSVRSRILYAIATSVVCKGDNGHWQACYSGIMGSLASGAISDLYHPDNNRGAAMVFENAAIGLGETAAVNLFQEFVVRKLTPNLPKHTPSTP
jgi:hypothetical protein